MKSPKQQVYDALFVECQKLNVRTFNKLPPKGTEYPFIVLGMSYKQDSITNKSFIMGNIQQHVHIYAEAENKIGASDLEFEITKKALKLSSTENFNLRFNGADSDEGLEVSDGVDLWHIDLEIDYRFS